MPDAFKSLVVVLALALTAFALAKPMCLKFMANSDFRRRRNLWVVLTVAGFLSPSLWIFTAVAVPAIVWSARLDQHPTALYLMIFITVPFARAAIPLPMVNNLFELTPFRIFALALLVPTAFRLMRSGRAPRKVVRADAFVIAFGLLDPIFYFPYESPTNSARRVFLFFLDTYVLYYVFSRGIADRSAMRDTLASFWLACIVLVPVVVFEAARSWLLYVNIPLRWGDPNTMAFLLRDGVLRAQGPAGHSLTMGVLFSVSFGVWLYLGDHQAKFKYWFVGAILWAGLLATFSRAPWLVGVAVLIVYIFLSPQGRRNSPGILLGAGATALALSATSFGAKVIALLPFIGTKEQENVEYREQVAEVSWRLIKQHPLFGDIFAWRNMEELRQGQGIIDLVNTYAAVAVFNGLVGLALFALCFVYPAIRTGASMVISRRLSLDDTNLGAALVACMVGILLMMATASFGGGFQQISWVFAGLCSAYPAIISRPKPVAVAARQSPQS